MNNKEYLELKRNLDNENNKMNEILKKEATKILTRLSNEDIIEFEPFDREWNEMDEVDLVSLIEDGNSDPYVKVTYSVYDMRDGINCPNAVHFNYNIFFDDEKLNEFIEKEKARIENEIKIRKEKIEKRNKKTEFEVFCMKINCKFKNKNVLKEDLSNIKELIFSKNFLSSFERYTKTLYDPDIDNYHLWLINVVMVKDNPSDIVNSILSLK